MDTKTIARFWSKVRKGAPDECWEWQGGKFSAGYGAFTINHQPRRAHRIAYEITYGQISDGLMVCHHCDNPACVRPDHLFLGTAADNAHDRNQKGRTKPGRNSGGYTLAPNAHAGERNPRAKLTAGDVRAIRTRRAAGEPVKALAVEYGISRAAVCKIVLRIAWATLDAEPLAEAA